MMAMGAYTPLTGFMGKADWHGCCASMKLKSGLFWPIPITLSCSKELADSIKFEETVALVDEESNEVMGLLDVTEKYEIDKAFECQHVFRTTESQHPGVAKVMEQGPMNLAGRVQALSEGRFPTQYKGLYYGPAETRARFTDRGGGRGAAFHPAHPNQRHHKPPAKTA